MSVTYQCGQCGQWHTVAGSKVGTAVRCGVCDHPTVVPDPPESIPDDRHASAAVARPFGRPGEGPKPSRLSLERLVGGALSVLGLVALVGFWLLIDSPIRLKRRNPPPPAFPRPRAVNSVLPDVDLATPIDIPSRFPDLGPAREVEPGVLVHEVRLRPERVPVPPGHAVRLWLYLPGDGATPRPGPLPCVLIAPAGSTCLSGMNLAPDDRPEHVPYVRAGFAVLAFELDGGVEDKDRLDFAAMTAFFKARAGLVNGRIAIAFLKAKVPSVDPDRLYVAGHSSAGTFALVLAGCEPSIRACVAYSPAIDLEARILGAVPRAADVPGLLRLVNQFSPRTIEPRLDVPTLLFAIRDDTAVPFDDIADSAARLKALGKPITFESVDSGGHYDAMIRDGIPRGVAFLKARDAEARPAR